MTRAFGVATARVVRRSSVTSAAVLAAILSAKGAMTLEERSCSILREAPLTGEAVKTSPLGFSPTWKEVGLQRIESANSHIPADTTKTYLASLSESPELLEVALRRLNSSVTEENLFGVSERIREATITTRWHELTEHEEERNHPSHPG